MDLVELQEDYELAQQCSQIRYYTLILDFKIKKIFREYRLFVVIFRNVTFHKELFPGLLPEQDNTLRDYLLCFDLTKHIECKIKTKISQQNLSKICNQFEHNELIRIFRYEILNNNWEFFARPWEYYYSRNPIEDSQSYNALATYILTAPNSIKEKLFKVKSFKKIDDDMSVMCSEDKYNFYGHVIGPLKMARRPPDNTCTRIMNFIKFW